MIVFECDVCGSTFESDKISQPNKIIIESYGYKGNARAFNIPSITKGETFSLERDVCPHCMPIILQFLYPKNEERKKSCEDCAHATVCRSYSYANGCDDYIHNYNEIKENNNG